MKPFETLKTAAAGITEKVTGENPTLLKEVVKLVQTMPDGFPGLIKQFQDKGLSAVAASLTGKGPTVAFTPEQMVKGFGSENIKLLAKTTGIDAKFIPEKLATLLPTLKGKLNPVEEFVSAK